jgi:hypothetical protein
MCGEWKYIFIQQEETHLVPYTKRKNTDCGNWEQGAEEQI